MFNYRVLSGNLLDIFAFQFLTPPVLRIQDAEKADIQLTLTVPFGCNPKLRKDKNTDACTVDLTLVIPSKLNQQRCEIFNLENLKTIDRPCGTRIKHDDVGVIKTISVANEFAGKANKFGQRFEVLLRTNEYKYHKMIGSYSLKPVTVTITT